MYVAILCLTFYIHNHIEIVCSTLARIRRTKYL